MERIDKLLANMGLGSRKEIKMMIKSGEILINGTACTDAAAKVDLAADQVTAAGRALRLRTTFSFMMNKPAGYLSASRDDHAATVVDLLSEEHKRLGLFPAGRLDRDAEGFLILTNDGALAHALTSPRRHVNKRYFVRYDGMLHKNAEAEFSEGMLIDGGERCLPAVLECRVPGEAVITVHEGRYHQVKRMIAAAGGKVTYLKRLSIGPISLDNTLAPGEYRELTGEELHLLAAASSLCHGRE